MAVMPVLKKVLVLAFFMASQAYADSCSNGLTGLFTSERAKKLCSSFYGASNNAVLGKSGLNTVNAVPRVSATGTLAETTFLIDTVNRRVYFDESTPVDTNIVADDGKKVLIAGGNQFEAAFTVSQPNAGAASWELISPKTTGAVGGGAFTRANTVTTIGLGYQTGLAPSTGATWDLDLIGTESGVGSGYDFSINNKNNAGSLRLQAGTAVVLGIGLNTSVPEVGRFTTGGLSFVSTGQTIAVDSGTAASACKGTSTHNGTTAVTISTTCAATGMIVIHSDTSDPTGTTASQCWFTNVVNGTSFDVDCDSANDATFSWLIVREG